MVQSMGRNAEVEFQKIKIASAGLIDQKSLTESANKAMSLGIPIEHLAELMEIARAKARDMGTSTSEAFNDIAIGVGRASPLILDNLGLIMKVGSANAAMAASLGKTVKQLTDKEKKMAVLNATLEAGKEALTRYDLSVKTSKERMDQLSATVKDLNMIMGQAFLRVMAGAVGAFYSLNAVSMTASASIWKLIEVKNRLEALFTWGTWAAENEANAEQAKQKAASDWKMALKYTEKANDSFRVMTSTTDELARAGRGAATSVKGTATAIKDGGASAKQAAKDNEYLAKAIMKVANAIMQKKIAEAWDKQNMADWG